MTSDRRPPTPALDAGALRDALRDNAVVAIHFWASRYSLTSSSVGTDFAVIKIH